MGLSDLLGGMGGLSVSPSSSATSAANFSASSPFVNNAELVLGSDGNDFSGNGVGEANPTLSAQQASGEGAALGPGASLTPSTGASLNSPQAASGQSAVVWVSVAGIVVACLLALHKSP